MHEISIHTSEHCQFINIDSQIQRFITQSSVENGICHIFVPHTTAGVTINENADPDVVFDLKNILNTLIPWDNNYRHMEGNSAAHAKASLMGFNQSVFIKKGRLMLGTWQSIYFCEFDGPRNRKIWLQIIPL